MNTVAEIKSYLFLGGAAGRTEEMLKKKGITLVINAAKGCPTTKKCIVSQVMVDADDSPDYQLKKHFDDVAHAIYKEKEKGGIIYVHCIGGISRGPTLVMAYLMKFEDMTLWDAHELVRKNRKFARPNRGFWTQLIEYEHRLKGKNTVEMFPHNDDFIPSVYKDEYKNMVT